MSWLDLEINDWFVQTIVLILCLTLAWNALKWMTSTTDININQNSRRLDFSERFVESWSHSLNGLGNLCCCISLTSKESLSHQHVHDALVLLVKRQPMLRAVVSTKSDEEQYFVIRNIEDAILLFDITKSDVKISDWKDIVFKYTSTVHKSSLPWKAVILQEEFDSATQEFSNMIMFAINHSCLDGIACVQLVQQFLNNLNDISSGVTNKDKYVASLELLPSAHKLVIHKSIGHSLFLFVVSHFGLRPILKVLLEKMFFYILDKKPINPYYQKHPPLLSDDIPFEDVERMNFRIFTDQETMSIVQACKANGCTVTGAITAAVHLAFYNLLDEKEEPRKSIETFFPINNRSFCDPKAPDDYIGFFLYPAYYYLNYSKTNPANFWIMAKESTAQLKEIVRKKPFVKEESLMSVFDTNLLMKMYLNKDYYLKGVSNTISSYGVFNFDHQKQERPITYSLKNSFIFPITPGFSTVFVHYAYTINGKLTWIIKSSTSIPDAHTKHFSNFCYNLLLTNCSSSMTEK